MVRKNKPAQDEGEGASPEDEMVALFREKLTAALNKLPPEVLEKARQKAAEISKTLDLEELAKLDLGQFTPEKMVHMAEVAYNEFKLGHYDRAEKIFRGLTVIDSGNYYYHQMLGATFQRQEKLPEAVLEYGVALQMNPRDSVSLTNRGECYFKSKVLELAERDFDAALALDPDNKGEDKWINRARVLKKQIVLIRDRAKK